MELAGGSTWITRGRVITSEERPPLGCAAAGSTNLSRNAVDDPQVAPPFRALKRASKMWQSAMAQKFPQTTGPRSVQEEAFILQ